MKKILFISAILLSAFCYKSEAQVSVNINIGRQPIWGPPGYDYVDYYYLPDLDVYYDVPRGMFVYFDYGRWNFSAALPGRYGGFDLYNCYKVVINDRDPWLRNNYYRSHYDGYRGRYQAVIRDSRDDRYYERRPRYENDREGDRHEEWRDNRRGGRDNGWGNEGRNNGRGNGDRDHGRGNRGGDDD